MATPLDFGPNVYDPNPLSALERQELLRGVSSAGRRQQLIGEMYGDLLAKGSPATPSESGPLSQALGGKPYGTRILGDQIVTRWPMVGNGGYIETTSPGDPRSLAGQWATGTGGVREQNIERLLPEAVRYRGGIEQEQMRAQSAKEAAEKAAQSQIEAAKIHANSAREAAEIQFGKGPRMRANIQVIRETLRREHPNWTEDDLNAAAIQQAKQNVDIEEAVTDRGVPTPAAGAANAPVTPKPQGKLGEYLEGIHPRIREQILGEKGAKVDIPTVLKQIQSLKVQEPRHFEDLFKEMATRYPSENEAARALMSYVLQRAIPLRIKSMGGVNILRDQGPSGVSIETPRGGLWHRFSPAPVYGNNKERSIAELETAVRLLGGTSGGVNYFGPTRVPMTAIGVPSPGF